MNGVVDIINTAGRAFVAFALPMLIQSSLLILILLAVDAVLRKKVRAVFRYWVWMLVLVKLVLPPSLWSPISIGTWCGATLEVPTAVLLEPPEPSPAQPPMPEPVSPAVSILSQARFAVPEPPVPAPRETISQTMPSPDAQQEDVPEEAGLVPGERNDPAASVQSPSVALSWQGLTLLIWAAVVAALLLLLVQRAFFVRGLVAQADGAGQALLDVLQECRSRAGVRKQVPLKLSPNAVSPAVCGLLRPVILMPQNLAPKLSERDLRAVLLHELAHVKRGDLWVNLVQTLLQIVYFYHPLLWLANAAMRRAREQAVDEAVLVALGQTAAQYPETLVNIAKLAFRRRPTLSLRLIGVVESKSALTARIRHMLSRPLPKTAKLGLLGLLIIAGTAGVLLPMAGAAEEKASVTTGGPLDIRLMGVCPDGSDELYDADGKKLDVTLPLLGGSERPWDSDQLRRDFILQVPDLEGQLLFESFVPLCGPGTSTVLTGFSYFLDPGDDPPTAVVSAVLPRTYRRTWVGLIDHKVPVRKVDLKVRYFYGARGEAICTFTGPFTEDAVVQADDGRPYRLTPKSTDLSNESRIGFDFVTSRPFDHHVPILIYDRQGRRYLAQGGSGDSGNGENRLTCYMEAVPWNQVAAVTVGEKSYEITFSHIVVDYPKRPRRTYPADWDRMAERLGLTGLSPEELARHEFKTAHEAIAVLDVIRGSDHIYRAVQKIVLSQKPPGGGITTTNGRPVDTIVLDAAAREKIRQVARGWLKSPSMWLRAEAVKLGLTAGLREFIDPAFALLEYRHPTVPYETRNIRSNALIGLWRYRDNLTAADIERLKQFVQRCDNGETWSCLFEYCLRTARRPEVSDALWELARDDRPWLWWPAIRALRERRDERLNAAAVAHESMKLREILVTSWRQPVEEALLPKVRAILRDLFTVETIRLCPQSWSEMYRAVGDYLDRQEATAVYMDFLEAASQPQTRWRFELDYGDPSPLYNVVSNLLRDINLWHGLNIGRLGTTEPGEISKSIYTARAFEQAVTEALSWYRAAGTPGGSSAVHSTSNQPSGGGSQAAPQPGPVAADASSDSDGDGLSDFQEEHKYLTDPTKKDSDSDGTPDGDMNIILLATPTLEQLKTLVRQTALLDAFRGDRSKRSQMPEQISTGSNPVEPGKAGDSAKTGSGENESAGSLLELRIAPKRDDLAPALVEEYRKALLEGRTPVGGQHLWVSVRPGTNLAPDSITQAHQGKTWLLVHNREPFIMVPGQGWRLAHVSRSTDRTGRPVVVLRFDDGDSPGVEGLTGPNPGRSLAVIVNGIVVSAAVTPQGQWRRTAVIADHFTERELENMMAVLRRGIIEPSTETDGNFRPVTLRRNGVTVELLGVCEHPSEGKQWWRPDGSPLEERPYHDDEGRAFPKEGEKGYKFAVKFSGLAGKELDAYIDPSSSKTTNGGTLSSTSAKDGKENKKYWNGALDEVIVWQGAAFDEELDSCDIRVGVSWGRWPDDYWYHMDKPDDLVEWAVFKNVSLRPGRRGDIGRGGGAPAEAGKARAVDDGTSLSGVVVDDAGRPLENVKVSNWYPHGSMPQETTTDAQGRFSFKDKRGYVVKAERAGLAPEFFEFKDSYFGEWSGKSIHVALTMTEGCVVTGSILSQDNRAPVPGAQVWLELEGKDTDVGINRYVLWRTDVQRTDDKGHFEFRRVPDGTLRVAADANGFVEGATEHFYLDDKGSKQADLALRPKTAEELRQDRILAEARRDVSLSGTVTDEAGRPVEAVEISNWFPHGSNPQRTYTDANGRYRFAEHRGYVIAAKKEGFAPVFHEFKEEYSAKYLVPSNWRTGPDRRGPITVNLVLTRGATLTGMVLSSREGTPVAGVRVHLEREAKDTDVGVNKYAIWKSDVVATDSSGRFAFEHVPTGIVRVFADGVCKEQLLIEGSAARQIELRLDARGSPQLRTADTQAEPGSGRKPPGQPEEALQRLIDEAPPGGVVTVPRGRYTTPVEISKPVVLRGESPEGCIIEVTADQPAVLVNTGDKGDVTIENMTIQWQLATDKRIERPVALLVKDTNAQIRNCRFVPLGEARRSPMAVYIDGRSKSTVENCRFSGFEYVICYGSNTQGVVEDCIITDCGHQGVINYDGATLTVQRCLITGSKFHAVRCTGGTLDVKDNLLIENANRAIYLGNKTGRGTITNNLILGNGSGISGFARANYVIANNVVMGNNYAGIDMRDSCRFLVRNNVLARNQRGLVLFKEGTENFNVIAANAYWANATDIENLDKSAESIDADPQFTDPNHGDFSVGGRVREQGHGLTDPEIIKQLWRKYEQLQRERPVATAGQTRGVPPSASQAQASAQPSTILSWQRMDRYIAPDPNGFFPDDAEAGRRLDAFFQAADKDRRSDEEVLSTVRQGFRRTTQHRTLILAWLGNRYIWGKDPQDAGAIEILYHAVPLERHYAIYFGLSVVKNKSPNILRTLADVCMQGEEVGRITWGIGPQREELLSFIKSHLQDDDPGRREIAGLLVKHFRGELDFEQWKRDKHLEQTRAQFGGQLPQFQETLVSGASEARYEVLTTILSNQMAPLLDGSFLPALQAASDDPDHRVRNEVARVAGGRWVWSAQRQDPNAIALMLKLSSDSNREVRYNAVYYGLSVVRDKSEPVVRQLVRLASADQERDFYGRIVWGLSGPMGADRQLVERILAAQLKDAGTDSERAALRGLYKDVLGQEAPAVRGEKLTEMVEKALPEIREPPSPQGDESIEDAVEAEPFLRPYEANDFKFEAGFVPDKTQYVWGEPMHYFTYVVRNTGDKPFAFVEGGDYRGGRSESHEITAVDAGGRAVPTPQMLRMGGLMDVRRLQPGAVYTKSMPVDRRLTFSGPGVYRVTGRRTLRFAATFQEAVYRATGNEALRPDATGEETQPLEVLTENSFQLTIHPYSPERMARLAVEVAAEIAGYGNLASKAVEVTEPEELTPANRLHLALETLVSIREAQALDELIRLARQGPEKLRIAAVQYLGRRTERQAMTAILDAFNDAQAPLRVAAAEALGTLSTEEAVNVLIDRFGRDGPEMAGALLKAMGRTRSPKVIGLLSQSLTGGNTALRYTAAEGLVAFGSEQAIELLKTCVADPDMDFRETVVRHLAESLRQPIDAQWLVPVVQSRKDAGGIGDAPRLMRLYAGERAVPALLSCLDFENPSTRSYYNHTIIDQQGAFRNALRIPWICDLNRDGSAEELEHNKWVLRAIRTWVDHYDVHRMDEEQIPELQYWEEQRKYWGEPADGIGIRIRCNQHVWPEGMPQIIQIDVRDAQHEGTINLSEPPEVLQIELNGRLYERRPPLTEPTTAIEGYGTSFHILVLDDCWRCLTDGQPLRLTPGRYTLTVRLSTVPEAQRTALAASQPVQFEIIAVK